MALAIGRALGVRRGARAVVEARAQDRHRFGLVLMLALLVLAGDDDAGRQMGDAHCGIGRVDMLSARALRTVGVDPQIGGIDVDIDLLGFR